MYFSTSTILASLGFLALVQASPTSVMAARDGDIDFVVEKTAAGEVESFVNATSHGVDIFGPIPDDGEVKEDGRVVAQPGSKAWTWIRAQIDIDWDEIPEEKKASIEKRQGWANIGIGMWAKDNCQGEASYFDNVQYNVHHVGHTNYYTFGIRHRGLRNGEQLDMSRLRNGDWCGQFVVSAASNSNPGCGNAGPINCFKLWLR